MAQEILELLIKAKADINAAFAELDKNLDKSKKNTSDAQAGLDKFGAVLQGDVKKGVAGLTGELGTAGQALSALGPYGVAAAAGLAVVSGGAMVTAKALTESAVSAVNYASAIADATARNRIGVEEFQKLGVSASLVNGDVDTMAKAVQMANKALVESPAQLRSMGIEVERFAGLKADQKVLAIVDALKQIEDPARRDVIGLEVLGKKFAEIDALTQGLRDGIGEWAETHGLVMGKELVGQLDDVGDAAGLLDKAWDGLWNNIGASIAATPGLKEGIKSLADTVGDLSQFILDNQPKLSAWFGGIVSGVQGALPAIDNITGKLRVAMELAKTTLSYWAPDMPASSVHRSSASLTGSTAEAEGRSARTRAEIAAAERAAAAEQKRQIEAVTKANAEFEKSQQAVNKSLMASRAALDVMLSPLEREIRGIERSRDAAVEKAQADFRRAQAAAIAGQATEEDVEALREQTNETIRNANAQRDFLVSQGRMNEGNRKHAELVRQIVEADRDAAEADRLRQEIAIDAWASIGESIAAVDEVMGAFGISADNVFRQMAQGAMQAADVIQRSLQQGFVSTGDMLSTGASIVQGGQQGGVLKGALGGGVKGAMIGSIIPGIGTIGGGLIGAGLGALGGIFGGGEGKKVKEMRSQFLDAAGGLDELKRRAEEAGVSIDKMMNAKKVKDFERAVKELNGAFDLQAQSQQALQEAVQKYGFTVDELGPKWKQQELDKQFAQLIQDQKLLTASGIEYETVVRRMAPAYNETVQAAVAAGVAIPENMRPALEKMIELGLLTDAAGNKMENLDGLTFTESLTEGLSRAIDAINRLVAALGGLPPEKTVNVNVNTKYNNSGQGPDDGSTEQLPGPEGYATGGRVAWTPGGGRLVRVAEQATENIVTDGQLGSIIARANAMGAGVGEGAGGDLVNHVHVYVGGQKVDEYMERRSRAGLLRL